MASVSLMGQTALLDSLAPNIEPTAPPWWPPAPGYWLGLMLLLALVLGFLAVRYHQRHERNALRQFALLRQTSSDPSRELHELLRWLAIHHQSMQPGLSPQAFAEFLANTTGRAAPRWLNSHYDPDSACVIEWEEARVLVRKLVRRQAP